MRISAFGEIMLRLTPPEYLLLEQTKELRMAFTGTGVNILSNLAHFGCETSLLTTLPDNRLGLAAKASMRQLGISDQWIRQEGDHIGSYFAEMGYGCRPTQVTYQNRRSSSFGMSGAAAYDFDRFLATTDLVHICGIALSLTEQTRTAALTLAEKAHQQGKKVCFDFNYRPSLNQTNEQSFMREQYEQILPYCDIVFGSQRDLTDLLGLSIEASSEAAAFQTLANTFMQDYQIEQFAGTFRTRTPEASELAGFLFTNAGYAQAKQHTLTPLDRIGAGDGYAAGVLLGYAEGWTAEKTVAFATMNSVLAHTIQDDVPLTTRQQVECLLDNPTIDLIR